MQTREKLTMHTPALKRYALSLTKDPATADDLLHDTIIRLLSGTHTTIKKPRPYMMSVMHNIFIDGIRRKPTATVPLEDANPVAREASQNLQITCAETLTALQHLPADYADVLKRHACEGQSYGEIARALGLPMGTVMSRIARGRATLGRRLGITDPAAFVGDRE